MFESIVTEMVGKNVVVHADRIKVRGLLIYRKPSYRRSGKASDHSPEVLVLRGEGNGLMILKGWDKVELV